MNTVSEYPQTIGRALSEVSLNMPEKFACFAKSSNKVPLGHLIRWLGNFVSRPDVAGFLLTKHTKDMHIFGDRQADINWENEEVRQELYKMLHWWLKRGLDGFRVWPRF